MSEAVRLANFNRCASDEDAGVHAWLIPALGRVTHVVSFELDEFGRVSQWGADCERLFGASAGDVLGQSPSVFVTVDGQDDETVSDRTVIARREGWHLETAWRANASGALQACQLLTCARPNGFVVVLRDTPEPRRALARAKRRLQRDSLTGAANRAFFLERAREEERAWRQHRRPFAVITLDIDGFKLVNNTFGHEAGDRVLKSLVARCRRALRQEDIVGRIGGDEFAVLLPRTGAAIAPEIAARLHSTLRAEPIDVGERTLAVTASLGVAVISDASPDLVRVLSGADAALYRAKQAGRDRVAYHDLHMQVSSRTPTQERTHEKL